MDKFKNVLNACKICGGNLIIIDEATGWIVCDTCDYEEQHNTVINSEEEEQKE